jgi:predicted transcriptional regulator
MRKPGPPREIPPPLELECLKALWNLGEGNVSLVRQALSTNRSLAYTTVMTVLDRLVRRGALVRRKAGRSYVYTPVLSRETLRRRAVRELLDSFFSGSERELVAYLTTFQGLPNGAPPAPPAEALDTTLL